MTKIFDKSFFKFLIGFCAILISSFAILYFVGNHVTYNKQINNKDLEAKTGQNISMENKIENKNTFSVKNK